MPVSLKNVADWTEFTIPGGDRSVQLRLLHADAESGAAVTLVRFPPGWRRAERGYYAVAEEFVVLEGGITAGPHLGTGDYALLPPRTLREDTHSLKGALVLAWFSGSPVWFSGTPAEPSSEVVAGKAHGVMRRDHGEVPGRYEVIPRNGAAGGNGADVLSLDTLTWEWVPAGATGSLTGSTLHRRTWS